MSDVILQTTHLTKEFKGFTAVSDVNLSVQRGSIHALIGPNGAGKTTCFNLLTKFLEPTSGEIRFNGHDITREAAREGVDTYLGQINELDVDTINLYVNSPGGSVFDGIAITSHISDATIIRLSPRGSRPDRDADVTLIQDSGVASSVTVRTAVGAGA